MITYFYDGEEYYQGNMEFDKWSGRANVKAGDVWLSCSYDGPYNKERWLRDNIESRLRNWKIK